MISEELLWLILANFSGLFALVLTGAMAVNAMLRRKNKRAK